MVQAPLPADRLLDCRAVAERLSIAPRSLWKLLASRRLPPSFKLGRGRRWRESDIVRFIELGCEWPTE